MIKFFRNIRYKLLGESRFARYLIYAIGEIVLVVIGILIALQINTWNEGRKESKAEAKILATLLEDLQAAETLSANYIASEAYYLDILETVLHRDSIRTILEDSVKTTEYFNKAFWDFEIKVPVINTYSDLKNAGNIAMIRNQEIRERLSILDASIMDIEKLIADRSNVHQIRIDEICVEDINFLPLLQYKIPTFNITTGNPNDYNRIMEIPRIRNLMGIKAALTVQTWEYRKNLHQEILSILQLIRDELSERDI